MRFEVYVMSGDVNDAQQMTHLTVETNADLNRKLKAVAELGFWVRLHPLPEDEPTK